MGRLIDIFNLKQTSKDKVILIQENEVRILPIVGQTEQSIHTEHHILPKADAKIKYFPDGGRAYIYNCDAEYLTESENIARLEKSVVLKNIFDYGHTAKTANIQFYVMIVALIVTIFLLRG